MNFGNFMYLKLKYQIAFGWMKVCVKLQGLNEICKQPNCVAMQVEWNWLLSIPKLDKNSKFLWITFSEIS